VKNRFKLGEISVYCVIDMDGVNQQIFYLHTNLYPMDLGHHIKRASSFIIMLIVGGALMPIAMGLLADKYSISVAYAYKAIAILAKNNIQVDEDEAAVILKFLYHVAKTYNNINTIKALRKHRL